MRARVEVLRTFTASVTGRGPTTDPDLVLTLAGACRERRRTRFDYTAPDGGASSRDVEPYRVLQLRQQWYLLAYDPDRAGWRTFRLDRMRDVRAGNRRFEPREPPEVSTLLRGDEFLAPGTGPWPWWTHRWGS